MLVSMSLEAKEKKAADMITCPHQMAVEIGTSQLIVSIISLNK